MPIESALPPGAQFNVAAVRQQLSNVAARGLSRFMIIFGLVLIAGVAVDALVRRPGLGPAWAGFAVMTFATGLAGALLLRLQHARAASTLMLVMASLAIVWNAWSLGLGIHSAGLVGLCLLVALAGLLVGMRAALLLVLLYGAAVAVMGWAEMAGVLEGRKVVAVTPIGNRLIGLSMVGMAGLVAAYVFNRLVSQVMTDAIGEQERLAELLRIGSDWTWEMDAKARMSFLSPSFEAGTGRRREEFMRIGEPGGPVIVEDAQWAMLLEELRERRPYRDREITFRCADGTVLVVRGNGAPVFADGTLVGWRGVSRNVTADRMADMERRRKDQLLDRLVRISPDPICVARLSDACILLANPAFSEALGTPDVVGRSVVELGLWDGVVEARRLAEILRRNDGVVRDLRTVVQLPGHSPRAILLTAAAFDWDGDPVAVVTSRDVTDVERSRLEADAILDNAGIGIALVREQRFERVNPTFESMFGRAPGTLAGRPVASMFVTQAAFDDFSAHLLTVPEDGGAVDGEREVLLPDGRTILAHLRTRPIDARHPAAAGTIWVAEDVTVRRRFERELAEAKRQADAANEAKSAFLATMSHEIRTPLNGIHGLARLLQDNALAQERRAEYLGHLMAAADHLSGIVSDVLDLSKIEAGRLQLEDIAFDLHALVGSTFRTFEPLGLERGLAMQCVIAPDVARQVRGDPVRVRQILANYLSNALKFTTHGEIVLRLGRGRDGRVRFEVRDTGIGVAAELHERLFKPFVQADGSTTRHYGGTGLGLSICKELSARMGGEVGVDKSACGGSLFWAELSLPPVELPAEEPVAATPGVRRLDGLRVLVAEDNPVNMLIISETLQLLGAQVLQAEDGERAIDIATREGAGDLHAVLMDLHMPNVDGLTAARRLREDPRTASLAIVAMSAAVLEHDRRAAERAGMPQFIAKPVSEEDLLRHLVPLVPHPAMR